MYSKEDEIIDLYGDGLAIDDVAMRTNLSNFDVLSILKKYRESQLSGGRYSNDLMMLVASRDSSGTKRKDIMSELGISRSFMVRAISEYGFLSKSKEDNEEDFYMNVDEGFEFKECPKCGAKKINKIQDGDGEISPSGIYCMRCGSEFTLKDNTVNIIRWEYVD